MLALPGPGWAAIFLGFAILATEFAFAEKVRDWLVGQLELLIAYSKKQWRKLRKNEADTNVNSDLEAPKK